MIMEILNDIHKKKLQSILSLGITSFRDYVPVNLITPTKNDALFTPPNYCCIICHPPFS
jgi:hypothetical protein